MDGMNANMVQHLDQLNQKRVDLKQKDEKLKAKIAGKEDEKKKIEDQLVTLQARLSDVNCKWKQHLVGWGADFNCVSRYRKVAAQAFDLEGVHGLHVCNAEELGEDRRISLHASVRCQERDRYSQTQEGVCRQLNTDELPSWQAAMFTSVIYIIT